MGRPPQIDRQAVLSASLQLADEGGLGAVTMQAVAERLGVTPMALYRHVTNKADLLDGVVESLLTEVPAPDPSLPGAEQLRTLATGIRDTARRHPTVFPLLLQRPASTPGARQTRALVYRALAEVGVPEAEVPRVERLLSTMVLGLATSEVGGRFAASDAATLDGDFELLADWVAQLLTSYAEARAVAAGTTGREV